MPLHHRFAGLFEITRLTSLMAKNLDVAIIGAGMAGLAAARDLGRAGLSVCILEARDRIGGRVFTQRDPKCDSPIELGAEFIHGKPGEILNPLQTAGATLHEVDGDNWCAVPGRLTACNFFSDVDSILRAMDDSLPDESFLAFLERSYGNPRTKKLQRAKQQAIGYVSGFNAADPAKVGVHWLVEEMRAEEKIQGDHAFRSQNGYADLLSIFRQQIADRGVEVRTATVVQSVNWRRGHARATFQCSQGSSTLDASRVLVTLPLSLLKAPIGQLGAIQFIPALPQQKIAALDHLEMGKAIRLVLRFRERFWDRIKPSARARRNLASLAFLFSRDEWFPTWWTTMPKKAPIITGWAPFRSAERLSGQSESFVVERSLETLSNLLGPGAQELQSLLEAAYFHDWQQDPFSMGAYSYGRVGADGAQHAMAAPLNNTLFFAGEATDTSGHNGTVHGAIASGHRAAAQILQGMDSSFPAIAVAS
jgi:monoamine oxidase